MSTTPSPDRTNSPSPNRRVIILVLLIFCLLFVASYTTRLVRRAQLSAEVQAIEARIAQAKDQQAVLQSELGALNSPERLEEIFRNELDMAKPDDEVIVVLEDGSSLAGSPDETGETAAGNAGALTEATAEGNLTIQPERPVWQQWVDLFTTAPAGSE